MSERTPEPTPFELLERVRQRKPVVHHLTNWVTIYDCAQVVKTLGASPVMAHAIEEVEDMTRIASALVLNIGTLTVDFVQAMKAAALSANRLNIPVVLDVCGAGATRLRDQMCRELLASARIDVIKGNASEIARVCGEKVATRGVDSTDVAGDMIALTQSLAKRREATVVVTGKVDIVTDPKRTFLVKNGHVMMTSVVGTGCMASSVIGAFVGVERDFALAAASALVCYGLAGELAAEAASGPASFKERFFDRLYALERETVTKMQRVEVA